MVTDEPNLDQPS